MTLRRWLTHHIVRYLTEPLPHYERRVRNDLGALITDLRKADVILVEGDQRVSAIIRYLSQSCWSHSALYIGDELVSRGGERAAWARDTFGDDAEFLIVEALPSGVVVSPVAKYVDYNVRVCRPHGIRPEHVRTLMDDAVAAIGWRYDLRNVFDLARYLIPVSFVPPHLRTAALHFGSGEPTEVICSSLLARLFAKIKFPIVPTVSFPDRGEVAPVEPRGRLVRRIFGEPSKNAHTGIFHMRHPTLITPRDFDLSPYFDIVKQNPLERSDCDYSRIQWDDDPRQLGAGPEVSTSLRVRS